MCQWPSYLQCDIQQIYCESANSSNSLLNWALTAVRFGKIFSQSSYPIPRHWYVPIDALLKVYTIEESNNIFVTKPRSERSDKYVFWWIITHSWCVFYHNIWWMSRCAETDTDRHLFILLQARRLYKYNLLATRMEHVCQAHIAHLAINGSTFYFYKH